MYCFFFLTVIAAGGLPLNGVLSNGSIPPLRHTRVPPKEPNAKASIHAKGTAAVHVKNPNDFKDAYLFEGKRGHLAIDGHSVVAGGVAVGSPGTTHPLRAKATGKAVMGFVTAPVGGRGNIRIKGADGVEDHHVPGGTFATKTGVGAGGRKARVITTVTRGGGVKVIAGPDMESLPQDAREA